MTKKLKLTWEAIYPIMIYMVILSVVMQLLKDYTSVWKYSDMLAQTITKVACIPAMYYFYIRGPKGKSHMKYPVVGMVVAVVAGVLFAIGLNNLIEILPLKEFSIEYQKVNAMIYSDKRIWQFMSAGICAPVLEEVLFRGVVCSNLKVAYGKWIGIIGSSLLFGALHFNFVQFLYALFLGLVFGYIYEETGSIFNCIMAHMAANVFSLVASWYGWNQYLFGSFERSLILGIVSVIVGCVLVKSLKRQ